MKHLSFNLKLFFPTLLLFSTFSLSVHAIVLRKYEANPKTISSIKYILHKFGKKDLEKVLREFIKCCRPSRMVGSSGHKLVIPYLVKMIKKVDSEGKGLLVVDPFVPDVDHAIKMYQQDFNEKIKARFAPNDPQYKKYDKFTKNMISHFNSFRGFTGKNLIWEKKGYMKPDEVIIVGAHYDTIANTKDTLEVQPDVSMPGADDNGSGVAILLGLIEFLTEVNLPKTVRVLFFDFEEIGFLGSRAYVQKYKNEFKKKGKLAGYINLEMLGHDTKRDDHAKKFGNMKIYIRKTGVAGSLRDQYLADFFVKIGKKVSSQVRFTVVDNSFNSSDHINFWEEDIPAITFTQNWEEDFNHRFYHTSNDLVETINLKTYYNVFKYISGGVIAWSFDISK